MLPRANTAAADIERTADLSLKALRLADVAQILPGDDASYGFDNIAGVLR